MKLTDSQAKTLAKQVNQLLEGDTFVLAFGNIKDKIHVLSNCEDKRAIKLLGAYIVARVTRKNFGK